jgi:fibronectin type 3 domain-containing protein
MVILLWAPSPSSDVSGYRLYRQEKGKTDRQPVQQELIRALSFRDSRVDPGKEYEYAIQAVDTHGNESPAVKTEIEQR